MEVWKSFEDDRMTKAINDILSIFNSQKFKVDEVLAILQGTSAIVIKMVSDLNPGVTDIEKSMAEDFKQSILANLDNFQYWPSGSRSLN